MSLYTIGRYLHIFYLSGPYVIFCNLYVSVQYIQPNDHEKLSQVELLVVDEAAAIPLPVVKSLLGPYLVFLSSTVNGYNLFLVYHVSYGWFIFNYK